MQDIERLVDSNGIVHSRDYMRSASMKGELVMHELKAMSIPDVQHKT